MASARGKSKDAPISEYEQQRLDNVAMVKARLASYNIPPLPTHTSPRKKAKKTHNTSAQATRVHNLRPRPEISQVVNVNEQVGEDLVEEDLAEEDEDFEPIGEFLSDNEDSLPKKKRNGNGRGISRLDEVFARKPGMPKIKVLVNEYGQPVGVNARRFSGAVGIHVRRKISIACADWRLVDPDLKESVWDDLQEIYDIDEEAYDWFLRAAAKKWKQFKASLKVQFLKGKLTKKQVREKQGERLNDEDWAFLKNYWTSPEFEALSEIGKANRAKLGTHHTSGSKSFACKGHEMSNELGRPPRRDELYIKTHTRKNGVPSRNAEPIINKIKSIIETQPELTRRTIQQGDAFAAACGAKEPKGSVQGLGLGPTPETLGTPGVKCYIPTKVQLQVLASKKAKSYQACLERENAELKEQLRLER